MWKRLRRKSPKGRQSIWQSEKTDGTAGRISDEIKRIFVLNRKERRGSSGRKSAVWIAFLLPSFLGVTVFVLIPFLDVVRRSFVTAVTQEWAGINNYRNVFENQAFRLAIHNTVRFTAVCLPLLIGLGLFLAAFLSRLKQIQFIKSLYLFPLAMPAATVVLIWKMLFSKQGFLNGALILLGVLPEGTLLDFMGTGASFWVLVASYLWKNTGYTVFLPCPRICPRRQGWMGQARGRFSGK